jgi:hypothetical protein
MMIFLPETDRKRVKSEIFLDLFQVAIIVGLTFTSLFLVPVQQMLPTDALLRNISVSNLESFFLLAAVAVRLVFARNRGTRALLLRLGFFLVACAVVTYIGNWIDLHHYATASAWFDLGWALPYVVAGLVAFTWTAPSEMPRARVPTFLSLLGTNLVLVAVLVCMNLMLDDWKRAHGAMLTDAAVAVLLLAFTFRLALTQYAQQQEIVQRKAAQEKLLVANQTISGLLEEAHTETSAITQINELGTLLQACGSRDEAFHAIPERMVRLFPGTSGELSMLNASRTRAESVAEWGLRPPRGLPGASPDLESIRPVSTPALTGKDSALQRENLHSDSTSVSIPLVANGEAIACLPFGMTLPFSEWFRPPTPKNYLAAASWHMRSPSTSLSPFPTSTCALLWKCKLPATRSRVSTTVVTCRNLWTVKFTVRDAAPARSRSCSSISITLNAITTPSVTRPATRHCVLLRKLCFSMCALKTWPFAMAARSL